MRIQLKPVDPTSTEVTALVHELDTHLLGLYPAASSHLDSTEELSKPHVHVYGAFAGDELVGCGAVKLMDEGYGEIKRIYVSRGARGTGAAKRILDKLESVVATAGLNLLRLESGIYQTEAMALFEKCGYTRIGPFGDYPDDPYSVFMEKQLNTSKDR